MSIRDDTPQREYYTNTHQTTELHPLDLFKRHNAPDADVVTHTRAGNTETGKTTRIVLIHKNTYEIWVKNTARTRHSNALKETDRVPTEVFNAISIKHSAVRNPERTDIGAITELLTSDSPVVVRHGVIALTHIAREYPETCSDTIELLASVLQTHTDTVTRKYGAEVLRLLAETAPTPVAEHKPVLQVLCSTGESWTEQQARKALSIVTVSGDGEQAVTA